MYCQPVRQKLLAVITVEGMCKTTNITYLITFLSGIGGKAGYGGCGTHKLH